MNIHELIVESMSGPESLKSHLLSKLLICFFRWAPIAMSWKNCKRGCSSWKRLRRQFVRYDYWNLKRYCICFAIRNDTNTHKYTYIHLKVNIVSYLKPSFLASSCSLTLIRRRQLRQAFARVIRSWQCYALGWTSPHRLWRCRRHLRREALRVVWALRAVMPLEIAVRLA